MVKENIDQLLEAGFIYPVVNSEWVSPIVVVPKKVGVDGKTKIRVCQDFRKLNASTKKDYFPIPFTNIILDHVSGHECYSFLDGFSGYNQVFIRPEDQLKTTFTTEWGTFTFNRMPFGLCNAPRTMVQNPHSIGIGFSPSLQCLDIRLPLSTSILLLRF